MELIHKINVVSEDGYNSDGTLPCLIRAKATCNEILNSKDALEVQEAPVVRGSRVGKSNNEHDLITMDKSGNLIYLDNFPNFYLYCGCSLEFAIDVNKQIYGQDYDDMIIEKNLLKGVQLIAQILCNIEVPKCYFVIFCQNSETRQLIVDKFTKAVKIRSVGAKISGQEIRAVEKQGDDHHTFDIYVRPFESEVADRRQFILLFATSKKMLVRKKIEDRLVKVAKASKNDIGSRFPR